MIHQCSMYGRWGPLAVCVWTKVVVGIIGGGVSCHQFFEMLIWLVCLGWVGVSCEREAIQCRVTLRQCLNLSAKIGMMMGFWCWYVHKIVVIWGYASIIYDGNHDWGEYMRMLRSSGTSTSRCLGRP